MPLDLSKRETGSRSGRLLPEHVDLGLRLTVGEGVLKKPFLESSHGNGHFPEMGAQTEPSPNNAYFPSLAGLPGTLLDKIGKVTSAQKTIFSRKTAESCILAYQDIPNLIFGTWPISAVC